MKKIKILNIITRLDRGGSAENTILTVSHIRNDKFDNLLISGPTNDPDGSISEFIKKQEVDVHYLSYLVRQINPIKDILAFFWLLFFIRRHKFDIVHTHASKAGIIGRWAAFFAGTKAIIHTPHGHVFYGYYGRLKSALFVLLEKITALITKKIITLTPKGIDEHVSFGVAKEEKFISIHSGVDIDYYISMNTDAVKVKSSIGISENDFVVGTVTRLEKVKDNKTLIKAFNEVLKVNKNAVLLIVGDGSERDMLEKLVKHFGIEYSVKFLGLRKDAPEIMSIFDVFAMASLNEGMGKVYVQASALGKPIVGTRVGGVEDVVLDGKTGVLVSSGDYRALGEAVLSLANDKDKRERFGKEALSYVTSKENGLMRFSVQLMISKLEDLYENVTRI
ncbi:MAG: glycosyltransferase family 4 protein [bacterium]